VSGLRVMFSVGSDVHQFDRLVQWADRWAKDHPDDEVIVQHGNSAAPNTAEATMMFGRDEMLRQLALADVVVLSCGPGAVMDARSVGRRPIVVPRRPDLGEHVDGHQLVFARHLHTHDVAVMAEDEAQVVAAVEAARSDPDLMRVDPDATEPPGIERLGTLIDELVAGRLDRGAATR